MNHPSDTPVVELPAPLSPDAPLPHRKVIRSWLIPLSERVTWRAFWLLALDYTLWVGLLAGVVLADVVWYAQQRFKPSAIVDLATLTGAITVALGNLQAGLFSNDDELAERLTRAGDTTQERLWRMPLGKDYDKIIDSKFADMKNSGGRYAGSITAAQFLKRFVKDTPWAHLDIAGVESWGDSAVVIRCRFRTLPIEQWGVKREYLRRLKSAFDAQGIEIPYPHMTVYAGQDRDGKAPAFALRQLQEN